MENSNDVMTALKFARMMRNDIYKNVWGKKSARGKSPLRVIAHKLIEKYYANEMKIRSPRWAPPTKHEIKRLQGIVIGFAHLGMNINESISYHIYDDFSKKYYVAQSKIFLNERHDMTLLAWAARFGDVEFMKKLLAVGAFVDPRRKAMYSYIGESRIANEKSGMIDLGNVSALGVASYYGQLRAVRELLRRGANVNGPLDAQFPPLGLASFGGHPETVRELLRAGASPNAGTRFSELATPLYLAIKGSNEVSDIQDIKPYAATVKILLEASSSPPTVNIIPKHQLIKNLLVPSLKTLTLRSLTRQKRAATGRGNISLAKRHRHNATVNTQDVPQFDKRKMSVLPNRNFTQKTGLVFVQGPRYRNSKQIIGTVPKPPSVKYRAPGRLGLRKRLRGPSKNR